MNRESAGVYGHPTIKPFIGGQPVLNTGEIIALIGFFVTVIGWIVTGLFQRVLWLKQRKSELELAQLRQQYDRDNEKRGYLVPSRMDMIDDMASWVEDGWGIRLEAERLNRLPFIVRMLGNYYSQAISPLNAQLDQWVLRGRKYIALAKEYDPQSPPDQKWQWGTLPLPNDLPTILEALQTEVVSGVKDKQQGRAVPKVYGLTNQLHDAAIRAIERVRDHLATQ